MSKATSFYFKLGHNEEQCALNVLHWHGGGLIMQIFAIRDNMVKESRDEDLASI